MKSALTSLTILLVTAVAAASSTLQQPPTKIEQPPIIKGEHISQVFAAACAENNFAEYQAWSLKNHYTLRQFDSPEYQISTNEIKDDELLFSVSINEQNRWQAKLRDEKFTGEDPCEVANAYLNARAPKQITLWTILIPEARAQKLVNEATATNWLLGALATAAITNGDFLENLANKFTLPTSFLISSAFRAINTANLQSSKTNFETLLNHKTELTCSRNRVKIKGKDLHIIVKKGYIPFRIGVSDNLKNRPIKNDSQILQQGRIYEHLLSLGQRCSHQQDADAIKSQLETERDSLNLKIAKAALLNRSISAEK